MENYYKLIILTLLCCFTFSCEENEETLFPASLKVVNGIPDAPGVHVNYFGRDIDYSNNSILTLGSSTRLTLLSNVANDLVVVPSSDTLSTIYQEVVNFQAGDVYTLFLTGQSENVEGLLLRDEPLVTADSVIGVRFINLSPDSGEVRFELTGVEQEFETLSYREISSFESVMATSANVFYSVQVKDIGGNSLAGGFLFAPMFKSLTLALVGFRDNNGINSLSVRQINSY